MPHEIAAPRTTDNGGAHALHPDRGVVGSMGAIIGFREIKGLAALMASIIAPTIALGAATLAYHGSMAKVYRDCEEAERRRNSERLGLFLRLHTSLWRVLLDTQRCILAVETALPQPSGGSVLGGTRTSPKMREAENRRTGRTCGRSVPAVESFAAAVMRLPNSQSFPKRLLHCTATVR